MHRWAFGLIHRSFMEHQGNSFKLWIDGDPTQTEWAFSFIGGFIDRKYVKLHYLNESGEWVDVPLNPVTDWQSDGVIVKSVPTTTKVEVYRSTPTAHPIVSYGFGGSHFSRESQSAAARQSLHIIDELIDGPVRLALYEGP
jgi:hypothetical protein